MSKELLTEILEDVRAVHFFLSNDLSREHLLKDNEEKRWKYIQALDILVNKIQSAHPSIRPRMNTPAGTVKSPVGGRKPPAAPPPEEGELYVECDQQEEAEEYLAFEPSSDIPQEVYEAMEPTEADVSQEVYEEPVSQFTSPDAPTDVYEDPEASRPGPLPGPPPGPSPTSSENMGSSPEYMETTRFGSKTANLDELSVSEWEYDISTPKGERLKVSELKDVRCKGYVEKLGGRNQKTWQKRYCVQAGIFMYFYEKESSRSYNNRIVLPKYTVSPAAELTSAKKKHFAFKLTHTDVGGKSKDYYFRCLSEETRETWLRSLKAALDQSTATMASMQTMTLPRMPSHQQVQESPPLRRTASFGNEGELYEEMEVTVGEEGDGEEYVALEPSQDVPEEEYVDIQPGVGGDEPQDEYEEAATFRPPSPTLPPPPSRAQPSAPRADPVVDTNKMYTQPTNGLSLENVFVLLWDFAAGDKDELDLHRGDLVYVTEPKEDMAWWFGERLDPDATSKLGVSGFFPRNYSTYAFQAVSS